MRLPGISETVGLNLPQLVDAGLVAICAKAGAEKKTGQDQPSFFVLDRFLAKFDVLMKGRPELANEYPIPVGLWRSKDVFKTLEKIRCAEFVSPIERLGKEGTDARASGIQPSILDARVQAERWRSLSGGLLAGLVRCAG